MATVGYWGELYPEFPARIAAIWNSDIPFVREKVARLKAREDARTQSWRSLITQRYGLTEAEASIVIHIVEGGSVAGYAQRAECSPATVRTHLKSIFRKTSLSRQSELATLFFAAPIERRR